MTYRLHTRSAWKLVLALAAMAVLTGPTVVRACSTPVYAYAMNNWAPTPFGIFYFYRDKQADEDKQVNLKLAELDAERPASTNMMFQAVDVAKKEELDRVSEMVLKVWRSHDDGKTPIHLVLAPWGAELFAGRLDVATLEAMIDSPARARIAELLGEGNAAVLLLLAAPDAKANKKAEEVIGQVTAKAASGNISGLADQDAAAPPAFLPPDASEKKESDDEPNPAEARPTLKLATLTIKRDDPAEKWFVRLLTLIESDLHEYAKEPMVFAVFGRGRALEPYLGKGITPENLVDCMSFLGGACSCMVKDQNPGADLLMQCDWDAVAEAMPIDEDPADDGQMAYQEFTPGEPVDDVSSGQKGSPEQKEPAEEEAPAKDDAKAEPTAKVSTPEAENATETSPLGPAAAGKLTKPTGSFASRQMWAYGLGLVVAALLVLGAGFVILRRQ